MSGRRETLLLVVVLLTFAVLSMLLMTRARQQYEEHFPPFTSYSPEAAGTRAYYELLEASGLNPVRYNGTEYHYPPGGCVVVISGGETDIGMLMGGLLDARALRLWIEEGGRLLLVHQETGISWTEDFFTELEILGTDMPQAPSERIADGALPGTPGALTALSSVFASGYRYELSAGRPALFAGVDSIELALQGNHAMPKAAVLLAIRDTSARQPVQIPLVMHRRVGEGEVIFMPAAEMWTNAWIARGDNHRLLLALSAYLAQGDPIHIDEHIHGYTRMSRGIMGLLLGTTGGRILLLALLAVMLAFAGAAVRPARYQSAAVVSRRQATETVLAQADLYRRAGARHVIAESLVERVRRALMEELHVSIIPSEQQLLEWLRSHRELVRHEPELESYLESRLLPPSGREVLQLARACDRVRHSIQRARRPALARR
jgi:hypothetical protein